MRTLLMVTAGAVLTLSANVFAQDGKAIYDKACHVCHAMGVANAPLVHDAPGWAPRLERGLDALVLTVKEGKGAMPPGGMCTDCTDEDYKKAIEYMSK